MTFEQQLIKEGYRRTLEGWISPHDGVKRKIQNIRQQRIRDTRKVQPCGHPLSAIVTNGTTNYCSTCADDSLRANIAAGVEL